MHRSIQPPRTANEESRSPLHAGILVLERSRGYGRELAGMLKGLDGKVTAVTTYDEARRRLLETRYAVALLEVDALPSDPKRPLPGLSPDTVYILLTRHAGRDLPKARDCGCRPEDVLAVHRYRQGRDELLQLVRQALALAERRSRLGMETATQEPIVVVDSDDRHGAHLCRALRQLLPRTEIKHWTSLTEPMHDGRLTQSSAAFIHLQASGMTRDNTQYLRELAGAAPTLPLIAIGNALSQWGDEALLAGAQEVLHLYPDQSALARALRRAQLRKLGESNTRYLATHDTLTGLINAAAFEERVEQALKRSRRKYSSPAVLYLDLDGFKPINDRCGHRAGDEVLREVARRLQSSLCSGDVAARLGGDEFAILVDNLANARAARQRGLSILAQLSTPIRVEGDEAVRVSGSIGIALTDHSEPAESPRKMITEADQAMMRAKRAGKAQVRIAPGAGTPAERCSLLTELESAWQRRQIGVAFEQQLCLRTNRLVGLSAVLRWTLADGRRVNSPELMPILEEAGMISQAGERLLRACCKRIRRWNQVGGAGEVRVGVRVGLPQLDEPDFAHLVRETMVQYGVEPQQLELQVTEQTLIHCRAAGERLEELRRDGVRISLVDFGYGTSSFTCLRDWELSFLHIHPEFIAHLTDDVKTQAMTRAVAELAHAFGTRVVATGVKTVREVELLRRLDCDACQGPFFGRPLCADPAEPFVPGSRRDSALRPRPQHHPASHGEGPLPADTRSGLN